MAVERWITVNGTHILLKDGQSTGDAIKSHFGRLPTPPPHNQGIIAQGRDAGGPHYDPARAASMKAWAAKRTAAGQVAFAHPGRPKPGEPQKGHDGIVLKPVRKWTNTRPEGMAEQTYMTHFEGPRSDDKNDPLKGLKPSEERKTKVHDPIVAAALKGDNIPPAGSHKVAIMTMGGPASGKGTVLGALGATSSEKGGHYVLVDPDEVKGQIPEYRIAVPKDSGSKTPTYKRAAAMVHEESSYIAKRVKKEAIEQGRNVIIDGTGTAADKYIAQIQQLRAAGYDVQIHFPQLDATEGLSRAKARANGSGRYVPDDFIRRSYGGIDNNVERIMAAAKAAGASFTMYDAGSDHHVVYHQEGGKEDIRDAAKWKAFQERRRMPKVDPHSDHYSGV